MSLGALDLSRLDRRVTIQKVTRATASSGEATETWADAATVAAEVREPTGKEIFSSEQRAAQIDRVFVIRWYEGLTRADHRIVYESGIYDIYETVEIGRRAGLILRAMVHRDAVTAA